jgi:GTP pyrophosphokinase
MKSKGVRFDEVYDLFAVRIILDVPQDDEIIECWKVYSVVTKHYIPKHDRLRDWISTPKANGYESLHTTVMSDQGRWVEVQIRTERMNEIAERGYAAHWKYKDQDDGETSLDRWISRINQLLKDSENEDNALEFFDEFKLNLFSDEIFVFTPKGELHTLPKNATALDFAYTIHSEVGNRALGAKVNHKVVSLNQKLSSGDQVEVLTSKKVWPTEEWLNYVITPRAINHIRKAIKQHRKKYYKEGEEKLKKLFGEQNIEYTPENLAKFRRHIGVNSNIDLFYFVAAGQLTARDLKDCCKKAENGAVTKNILKYLPRPFRRKHSDEQITLKSQINNKLKENPKELILGDVDSIKWETASCCNPIPGDDVIGYIKSDEVIEVHRINCPTAIQLMSKFGTRIVKAKWREKGMVSVLAGIKVQGIDKKGLVGEITDVISQRHNINIRSFNLQASDGIMSGEILLYVNGNKDLLELIKHLKKIKSLQKVYRISRIS